MQSQGRSHGVTRGKWRLERPPADTSAGPKSLEPKARLGQHLRIDVDGFNGTDAFMVQHRFSQGARSRAEVKHQGWANTSDFVDLSDPDQIRRARRIGLVNQVVLPEVGRALAFSAVKCRIDQVLAGSAPRDGSVVPTPRLPLSPEQHPGRWDATGVRQPTLEQAFDDSLFLMQSQEGEDGGGRFAVWWCADYQNLGGGGGRGSINWDGDVSSWHVGADARIGPGLLAGVSVSRSRGSFDYQGAGRSRDAAVGGYELGLASIHPYLAWSVLPDLDVWGTAGHAWGRLQIVDEQAGEFHTSPAMLDSGMVGVSGRLLARGATTLRLKGEWALAQLDVARAGTAFEAATMNMRRLRLGTEVSREHVFASGVSLTPWGELGLRHDGGDGETGAGLELGGGLRYLDREAGLTVEGHGRWQTTMIKFVKHHVTPGSTVCTDGLKGFEELQAAGVTHVARTQPRPGDLRKGAPSVVPLADRAIGNLQQWLIGTYHGVSKAQLQVYLDEFVFRHNRRRTPQAAFQTLLGLGTGRAPTPYRRIRGARDVAARRI